MIRRAPTKHKIALSGWWGEPGAVWYCFQCGRTWRGAVIGPCVEHADAKTTAPGALERTAPSGAKEEI